MSHSASTASERLTNNLPERRFRPELHGVRGLALLGVVVFHLFGNGRISGGIDIFLAVTGFLFTGMLLREASLKGGWIDPLKYFGRLVLRILIPAVIVVAAIMVLGLLISPVTEHRQLWAEARASMLYFENIELINSQLSYGAAGPETSPFQHFWSLSVQGQFYLVWPLVAIIAVLIARVLKTSAARVMTILASVIFVVSFVYAIYVGSYNQAEAYLMTQTRAWQLAFGALVALLFNGYSLPGKWRMPVGWLGVFLIVSCGFVLDGAQLFPGPWAFWPLLGLAFVLLSAPGADEPQARGGTAVRFLSNKPLAWIGDHSYALYLWHWPLIIFYLEFRDRESIGIRGAAFIFVVAMALAMLTYRYVEKPLQNLRGPLLKTSRRRAVGVVATAAIGLTIAGVAITPLTTSQKNLDAAYADLDQDEYPGASQYLMSGPLPSAEPFPEVQNIEDYKQEYLNRNCAQIQGDKPGSDEIRVCEDEDPPENPTKTIVLAGGSHAGHLEGAFKALGEKYDWEVLVVIKHACLFGWEKKPGQETCGAWNEKFIHWLQENDVDLVVTPGTRAGSNYTDEVLDEAPKWWKRITDTGANLLLPRGVNRVEPGKQEAPAKCVAEGNEPDGCGPEIGRVPLDDNPLEEFELPTGAYTIDTTKYICPNAEDSNKDHCSAVVGNIFVWFDGSHLTTPFSVSLAPAFEHEMKKEMPFIFR